MNFTPRLTPPRRVFCETLIYTARSWRVRIKRAFNARANDDSSHVRITIYVGTCSSWFLKPLGAKDNGREERSGRIAKETRESERERDHEERRMDRWTWWIRRSRGSLSSPSAYRFWKLTRGWSLSVFPISHRALLSPCTKDGTKIHRHWPANCPQGADPSTWVALACRDLIRF